MSPDPDADVFQCHIEAGGARGTEMALILESVAQTIRESSTERKYRADLRVGEILGSESGDR